MTSRFAISDDDALKIALASPYRSVVNEDHFVYVEGSGHHFRLTDGRTMIVDAAGKCIVRQTTRTAA